MKKACLFFAILAVIWVTSDRINGQTFQNATTKEEAEVFMKRLSANLKEKEVSFELREEQSSLAFDMDTSEPRPGLIQVFQSDEYRVTVSVGVMPSEEKAIKLFRGSQISADGVMGVGVPNLGDEAYYWRFGKVEARKGKLLIEIQVDSKRTVTAEEANLNLKAPREVAERFTKEVLDFLAQP